MENIVKVLKISNKRGLHARASAKFVSCVEQYDCDIRVSKDGHVVGGTSIMGLMMLAASKDSIIHLTASGPEAEKALEAVAALVGSNFGEPE